MFRNICRVCEAAGWAAECPGPRSSPATAEWRVMRILYPSVSRHSPSSPPTSFILFSHHTNSYGHKMEKKPASKVKWETNQFAGCLSDLPALTFAFSDWQSGWHKSPSLHAPSSHFIVPITPNQCSSCCCQLPSTRQAPFSSSSHAWVHLLVAGQPVPHIWKRVARWGHRLVHSTEVLSSYLRKLREDTEKAVNSNTPSVQLIA